MRTYVITGATGNTGRPTTLGLLEKGHTVRIISRSPEKARELVSKGARLFEGDLYDVELLKRAFSRADAVYVMIPFDAGAADYTTAQVSQAKAISEALKATGVKHAVTLSSVGAHMKSGNGVVSGLTQMEDLLNAVPGLNVLHLRATYFMENTLAQVGAIKYMGAMGSPVKADLPVPMIATKDIAAAALKHLLALDFTGKRHQYLLGPRDYTYNDVARVFGQAIGKPDLKYHQASYQDAKQAMMGMGMGESVVDKLNEFVKAMNEGDVLADARRTLETTTPTTLEQFAPVFKSVFEKG